MFILIMIGVVFLGYLIFIIPGLRQASRFVENNGVEASWQYGYNANRRRKNHNDEMFGRAARHYAAQWWSAKLHLND